MPRKVKFLVIEETSQSGRVNDFHSTTLNKIEKIHTSTAQGANQNLPGKNISSRITTDPFTILKTLANHYASVSFLVEYNNIFLSHRLHPKNTKISFDPRQFLPYNLPITEYELSISITTKFLKSHRSAKMTSPQLCLKTFIRMRFSTFFPIQRHFLPKCITFIFGNCYLPFIKTTLETPYTMPLCRWIQYFCVQSSNPHRVHRILQESLNSIISRNLSKWFLILIS